MPLLGGSTSFASCRPATMRALECGFASWIWTTDLRQRFTMLHNSPTSWFELALHSGKFFKKHHTHPHTPYRYLHGRNLLLDRSDSIRQALRHSEVSDQFCRIAVSAEVLQSPLSRVWSPWWGVWKVSTCMKGNWNSLESSLEKFKTMTSSSYVLRSKAVLVSPAGWGPLDSRSC